MSSLDRLSMVNLSLVQKGDGFCHFALNAIQRAARRVWDVNGMPYKLRDVQESIRQVGSSSPGLILFLSMIVLTTCTFAIVRLVVQRGEAEKEKEQLIPATHTGYMQPLAFSRPGEPASGSRRSSPMPSAMQLPTSPLVAPASGSPSALSAPSALSVSGKSILKSHTDPLCAALVMPECEARLLIPKHAIPQMVAGGDLVIFGLSGNPLLHAYIREQAGKLLLQLSLWHDVGTPCASIQLPSKDGKRTYSGAGCDILGPDSSLYGRLKILDEGSCSVERKGVRLMIIDGDTGSLQLTIKSVSGESLASVICNNPASGGVEHVVIKVAKGNDVVLIVACTLAVLLMSTLGVEAQLESLRS